MNILIISQYFWPENFRINEITKHLSKKNKVTVLTGYPSYPQKKFFLKKKNLTKFGSVKIIRLPTFPRGNSNLSLILNYTSFLLSSIIFSLRFIIKSNFDRVIVFGTSPPSGLLAAHIIRIFKNVPIYYWILDLWPETLLGLGINKKNLFYIVLKKFMEYSYKNCEYIFCQSRSIENLIKKKINNSKKAIYFPSWSEDLPFNKRKNINKLIDKKNFNIMFTGNVGEAQDFNSIVKAAKILKKQNIKWIIVGTGRFMKELKFLILREKIERNFIFLGSQEKKYINHIISFSDCLLITLKNTLIFSKTVPGKLSNYMISKKPIIGMISGDTKKIINLSKCGLCCNAGNYLKLSQNILILKKKSKKESIKLGKNGYKYAKKFFNREKLFQKFEKLLLN